MGWRDGYLAVDWGTTNRRAYRIDAGGALTDQFEDAMGVTAVPAGGFEAAVAQIRSRLGDLPMLLAGMIGSNRGWHEAPYAPCPTDLDALARSITWIEPARTGIVPGVSQSGAAGADVMRGEETQVLGAVAAGMVPADGLICHPGTHAKWITMESGAIAAFRTMMTGEIFSLLKRHSILADLLGDPVRIDAGFHEGVDKALAGGDLLSGLFRIRARNLLNEGDGGAASYASGLLIGCDVRAGVVLGDAGTVALVGRPDLAELYAVALAKAGRQTVLVDGAAAFLTGIQHLAKRL